MTEDEITALDGNGWFSREDCPGADAGRQAGEQRVSDQRVQPAGINRNHTHDKTVRGDSTAWLASTDLAFSVLWGVFEALRCELNSELWLGLGRFELQLAHYAGNGEGYARHKDAFHGRESRRVTAIIYLNRAWKVSDGGELRIHSLPTIDIAPMLGRLIVFRSAVVEHEVLASWAPRLALTAWYYG